jgi:hypothetical protein
LKRASGPGDRSRLAVGECRGTGTTAGRAPLFGRRATSAIADWAAPDGAPSALAGRPQRASDPWRQRRSDSRRSASWAVRSRPSESRACLSRSRIAPGLGCRGPLFCVIDGPWCAWTALRGEPFLVEGDARPHGRAPPARAAAPRVWRVWPTPARLSGSTRPADSVTTRFEKETPMATTDVTRTATIADIANSEARAEVAAWRSSRRPSGS